MNSHPTWIVVADGAAARFFVRARPETPLAELDDLALTLKAEERRHHRPGHLPEGVNRGPLVRPAHQNLEEDRERHFLGHVAGCVNKAVDEHAVGKLVLVAPPHALGVLRSHLSKSAEALVGLALAKDVTKERVRDLDARIKEQGF